MKLENISTVDQIWKENKEKADMLLEGMLAYSQFSRKQLFSKKRYAFLVILRRILITLSRPLFQQAGHLYKHLEENEYRSERSVLYNDLQAFKSDFNTWPVFRQIFLDFKKFYPQWEKNNTYRVHDSELAKMIKKYRRNHFSKESEWLINIEKEYNQQPNTNSVPEEIMESSSCLPEQENQESALDDFLNLPQNTLVDDLFTLATTQDSEM